MAILDAISRLALEKLPTVFLCILLLYLAKAAFTAWRGPLTALPGPEITKWTDLYLRLMLVMGKRAQYVHSLHLKYGPVVRIGPHDVAINDQEAAVKIHRRGGGFPKSSFYATAAKIQSMFSTRDRNFHASRRRLLGPCFAEASLVSLQPAVLNLAHTAISNMKNEFKVIGYVDILKWWTLFSMDVIGQLSFGDSFGMVASGKKNQYAEDVSNAGSILPLRTAFPSLLWMGMFLPIAPLQNLAKSRQRMMAYNRQRVTRYMELVEQNASEAKATIFASLIKGNAIELTDMELMTEAQSYITAGTDTTAITLSYLIWAVCRNEEVKGRLLKELEDLPYDDLTYRDIRDLPYLACVIEEALRRYGAAPGALPREVPVEGAVLVGQHIPGGTIVSTQAYSLHRDPSIFPNPDEFMPSRWENPTKEMRDAFSAFGTGPRGCVGVHLARIELSLVTALFFKAFPNARVSTKQGMSDQDMDELVTFLLVPKGHRCLIELE